MNSCRYCLNVHLHEQHKLSYAFSLQLPGVQTLGSLEMEQALNFCNSQFNHLQLNEQMQ